MPCPDDAAARLAAEISACRLCAERFAATRTAHAPRPVALFASPARLLIAGQAPGLRVHESGRPFSDASGERLREWTSLDEGAFYDRARVAIVPMAFCFPGYDERGSDLPPPRLCRETWHARVMATLPALRLMLLVSGHAQRWHLGTRAGVTQTVADWRTHAAPARGPRVFPLPHPSWRNTAWLRRNPWFETELLPDLRRAVEKVMHDDPSA